MSPIHLAILKTLVYFDCLDRALTATEVYFYLANVRPVIVSEPSEASAQEGERGNPVAIRTDDEIASSPQDASRPSVPRNDGEEERPTFLDVLHALGRGPLPLEKFIDEKNGYYFLKGREHLYEERIERLKIADQFWKKMRRVGRWMQLVPYVRLVMASGSLGMQHMTADSDLDVLVVLKHGRIWTGRFLLTALLHFLGVRRHGRYVAGRVCLNHYITDQSLHIPFHSLYNAMTYAQLVPIYELPNKKPAGWADSLRDSNTVQSSGLSAYNKYSRAEDSVKSGAVDTREALEVRGIEPLDSWLTNPSPHQATPRAASLYHETVADTENLFWQFQSANLWIRNYLPNWQPGGENLRTLKPDPVLAAIGKFLEWCLDSVWGDFLERMLRCLQLRRIQRRPETYAPGGRVRTDDYMLEFHPNSPEKLILDKFNKKMRELGLSGLADERDSGL